MAIPKDKYFYVSNGAVLKSKEELLDFLKTVDEGTFHNHVNAEKNDFALWVGGVLGEKKLSKKMSHTTNADDMIGFIEETIKRKESSKMNKKSIISKLVGAIADG